jgi:hypothetical protein
VVVRRNDADKAVSKVSRHSYKAGVLFEHRIALGTYPSKELFTQLSGFPWIKLRRFSIERIKCRDRCSTEIRRIASQREHCGNSPALTCELVIHSGSGPHRPLLTLFEYEVLTVKFNDGCFLLDDHLCAPTQGLSIVDGSMGATVVGPISVPLTGPLDHTAILAKQRVASLLNLGVSSTLTSFRIDQPRRATIGIDRIVQPGSTSAVKPHRDCWSQQIDHQERPPALHKRGDRCMRILECPTRSLAAACDGWHFEPAIT